MFGRKSKQTASPASAPSRTSPAVPAPVATPAATKNAGNRTPGGKGVGKIAYETRRAEKNGMGLEKWMAEKDRRAKAERDAIADTRRKADAGRQAKPGLLRRLLDRAHKPL